MLELLQEVDEYSNNSIQEYMSVISAIDAAQHAPESRKESPVLHNKQPCASHSTGDR
jgi:hypothetical protein